MDIHFSQMGEQGSWDDKPTLLRHIALQLKRGRVALAIGAGASQAFGLPGWDVLVDRCFEKDSRPEDLRDNEKAAEFVLETTCVGDPIKFAERVRQALYRGFDPNLENLANKSLVTALGALAMTSIRGSVQHIVSYNFDDVLESYLRYHGFAVTSVDTVPEWPDYSDVRVYHPHGMLPSYLNSKIRRPIVFTTSDFVKALSDSEEPWKREILRIYESHFVLFVGLSGDDMNLCTALHKASKSHRARRDRDLYWGVRFSADRDDPNRAMWKKNGIHQYTVNSWGELPRFLLEICQRALSP